MNYRADIDGLRGVSVLAVVLFHAGFDTFSGGFIGVDVFFVISGYLITGIILSDLNSNSFSLLVFFRRRILRIVPALFAVLIATVLAASLLVPNSYQVGIQESAGAAALFVSNFYFLAQRGYFEVAAQLQPLLHTWTLGVEAQFYLLMPFLLLLVSRVRRANPLHVVLLLSVASFAFATIAVQLWPSFAFFMLPTRAWELLLGSAAACLVQQNRTPTLSRVQRELVLGSCLVLIAVPVFAYSEATPFPGPYALAPTLGAMGICLIGAQKTSVILLLNNRFLVPVGLASYSIYLWHQPLFAFARMRSVETLSWDSLFLLIAVSFIAGFLSWRLIERPFKNGVILGKNVTAILSALGIVVLSFASEGLAVRARNADDQTVVVAGQTIEIPKVFRGIVVGERNCSFPELDGDVCILPGARSPESGPLKLVVLGDSHARVLSEAIYERKPLYSELADLTASGCPFLLGLTAYYGDGEVSEKCTAEYQARRLAFLQQYADEDTVIVLSARLPLYLFGDDFDNTVGGPGVRTRRLYMSEDGEFNSPDHEANFLRSLEKSVQALEQLRGSAVVVLPTHVNGWDPNVRAKLISAQVSNLEQLEKELEIPRGPVVQRNRKIDDLLIGMSNQSPSLISINPRDFTCSQERDICSSLRNGVFLFQGSDHLALPANRWITDQIESQVSGQ